MSRRRRPRVPRTALLLLALGHGLAHGAAGATEVVVTHLGVPVESTPLELIDARSGEVIGKAVTDGDGVARFEEIPPEVVFEAQTPNGRFASPPFRAGERVELIISGNARDDARWGLAVEGGITIGNSAPKADSRLRSLLQTNQAGDPVPDPIDPQSRQIRTNEEFAAGLASARLLGPAFSDLRIRPLVEASYEPEIDGASTRLDQFFLDFYAFELTLEERWSIGAGVSVPLSAGPRPTALEVGVGYGRQTVKIDDETNGGAFPRRSVSFTDEEDFEHVTVRLGLPVSLWRRGGLSAHLALGLGFAFPISGRARVESRETIQFRPNPSTPTRSAEVVRHVVEFEPSVQISGSVALRLQYDRIPLPSLE